MSAAERGVDEFGGEALPAARRLGADAARAADAPRAASTGVVEAFRPPGRGSQRPATRSAHAVVADHDRRPCELVVEVELGIDRGDLDELEPLARSFAARVAASPASFHPSKATTSSRPVRPRSPRNLGWLIPGWRPVRPGLAGSLSAIGRARRLGRCDYTPARRRSLGHGRHPRRHRDATGWPPRGARRVVRRHLDPRRRARSWSAAASGSPPRIFQAHGVDLDADAIVARLTDARARAAHRARRAVAARGSRAARRAPRRHLPPRSSPCRSGRWPTTSSRRSRSTAFDVVVTGDTVEHAKPHPEPYLRRRRAARRRRSPTASRSRTRPAGLASAVAAGAITVGVPQHHLARRDSGAHALADARRTHRRRPRGLARRARRDAPTRGPP